MKLGTFFLPLFLACDDGYTLVTLGSRQVCLKKWGREHANKAWQICSAENAVLPLPLSQAESDDFKVALRTIDSPGAVLDLTGKF